MGTVLYTLYHSVNARESGCPRFMEPIRRNRAGFLSERERARESLFDANLPMAERPSRAIYRRRTSSRSPSAITSNNPDGRAPEGAVSAPESVPERPGTLEQCLKL